MARGNTQETDLMSALMRTMVLLLLVMIFLLSVGFSFFNTQQVPLSFGFFVLPAQPVALWVLGAFAAGGSLGLLFGSGLFRRWRLEREISSLRTQISDLKKSLAASSPPSNSQRR
jgi:uncharacterized integral membrane protein